MVVYIALSPPLFTAVTNIKNTKFKKKKKYVKVCLIVVRDNKNK